MIGQYSEISYDLCDNILYVSFKGLKIQPQVVYNVVSKAKCKVSVKIVSSIPNNEK